MDGHNDVNADVQNIWVICPFATDPLMYKSTLHPFSATVTNICQGTQRIHKIRGVNFRCQVL